jgi:hypothetical protein
VLEHVSNPVELLQSLQTKLNPGGLFFIEGPLECNPSLAYYFRRCTYWLRSMWNKESTRVKVPYHVSFSNYANQQQLFERLHWEKVFFSITESGWPYVDTLKQVKSPWLFVQYIIAGCSILSSALVPNWGNRFTYIGRPKL